MMKYICLKNVYQCIIITSLLYGISYVMSYTTKEIEDAIYKLPGADLYAFDMEPGHYFNYTREYPILKRLVMMITTRVTYGKDVALYKWINGLPILDELREIAILEKVAETAKNLSVPFEPQLRLFFKNLMEATKFVEYTLISDWYYGKGMKPPVRSVNLNDTREKLNSMQVDIIQFFSNISDLRLARECSELVNKAINETGVVNKLTIRGVQRAFGCMCTAFEPHWTK